MILIESQPAMKPKIILISATSPVKNPHVHKTGDKVKVKYSDGEYYPATFVKSGPKTHTIRWHDGGYEQRVKHSAVKPIIRKPKVSPNSTVKPQVTDVPEKITVEDVKKLTTALCVLAYFAFGNNKIKANQMDIVGKIANDAVPVIYKLGLPFDGYAEAMNEVAEKGVMESSLSKYQLFLKAVQAIQGDLAKDSSQSPVLLELLNDARKAANNSEPAMKALDKNIGLLRDPNVMKLMNKRIVVDNQRELLPQIGEVVKKLGGTGSHLTLDQKKPYQGFKEGDKGFNPDYQHYLKLHSLARDKAKEYIRNWVRSNSDTQGLGDYAALMADMKKDNIVIHSLPEGFVGKIDDQGRLFTSAGKLINGQPGGGKVVMNPDYNPTEDNGYVFKAIIPGALSIPLYYTHDWKAKSTQTKFEKVDNLSEVIDNMTKKWRAILKAGGKDEHDPRFLASMLLEIVYQTQARIGGVGNATMDKASGKYKKTYGISTIECRFVRPITGGLSINYSGKKAGKQNHKLLSSEGPWVKKIVNLILKWKSERQPNDPVFMTRRGTPVPAAEVNGLIKQIGGPEGITIHKLRTLKGTGMMDAIVAANPFKKMKEPTPATKVTAWLKKQAESIGKQLGHFSGDKVTGNTAIQAYCNPTTMITLYKDARSVPPKTMLKLVGVDPTTLTGYDFGDSQ